MDTERNVWRAVDLFFTALTRAAVLDFVLVFVGASRRFRGHRKTAWGVFTGLGLPAVFVLDAGRTGGGRALGATFCTNGA